MLYSLGALAIEVHPFNTHAVSERASTDYAVKPVAGAEPPLEHVGEGGTEMSLSGRIFPQALGGMDQLAILHQMRVSGLPQYLMRGDGKPLGWFAILSVDAEHSYLDAQGVGKQIDISISLRRAKAPSNQSFFALISGLL